MRQNDELKEEAIEVIQLFLLAASKAPPIELLVFALVQMILLAFVHFFGTLLLTLLKLALGFSILVMLLTVIHNFLAQMIRSAKPKRSRKGVPIPPLRVK